MCKWANMKMGEWILTVNQDPPTVHKYLSLLITLIKYIHKKYHNEISH
jgi:hypothetical protein